VTAGAFKKFLVMHAVAFGVGLGLILGVARILFGWSSLAIVLPGTRPRGDKPPPEIRRKLLELVQRLVEMLESKVDSITGSKADGGAGRYATHEIEAFWLILEGLEPGERIVYEGLQKVREGAVVNPTLTEVQPTIEENP